jgi:arylsulfatase A-like enzyme
MLPVAVLAVLLASSGEPSKNYFTGLDRAHAPSVIIGKTQGPVILIVVDALRPDHLSAYGYQRPTSPNLQDLANDGLVLSNYFVNGNWTRPSTASMLTGLLPGEHRVESEQDRLAEQYVTMAEMLAKLKIPTGAVVGNGNAGSAFGLGRGFSFFADTAKHWKGLPSAEQVLDLAVPFVKAQGDQPFFLMLFFVDTHNPYGAPEPFENMFVLDPTVPLIRTPRWEGVHYPLAEIERMKATYDGAIRYTDTVLGKLFATLRQLHLYDRTLLLVTADHGEAFGEHGVFMHSHHLYDEIIRAPLIVRAPVMSRRGVYCDDLFQTIDLLPTIVSYFGGSPPASLPGEDMFAHLRAPWQHNPNRRVITEFNNFGIHRRMIRDHTHKVVVDEPADKAVFLATVGREELLPSVSFGVRRVHFYDVGLDPFEENDIYSPAMASQAPWWQLVRLLEIYEQRITRHLPVQVVDNLDAETSSNLKSLGYIQ